jgi:AraC family transcriptional regulator, exoenzyme S synthesis regulatory protein ExsA
MNIADIKSCYIGPAISPEQFIPEHIFLFLAKGLINAYDGSSHYELKPGEYCLLRKNRLGRYSKQEEDGGFEKVVFIFDEPFLKKFQKKYSIKAGMYVATDTFIRLRKNPAVLSLLAALVADNAVSKTTQREDDRKREELLLLLLKLQPELAGILFDYGIPGKINLEEFMNRNFRFNVNLERFAYLTGRSLSAFKRDFKTVFQETPSRWLVRRRLQEAHFLLNKKRQKPTDIYLDLGFENLTHFSFAFKKLFGINPSEAAIVK